MYRFSVCVYVHVSKCVRVRCYRILQKRNIFGLDIIFSAFGCWGNARRIRFVSFVCLARSFNRISNGDPCVCGVYLRHSYSKQCAYLTFDTTPVSNHLLAVCVGQSVLCVWLYNSSASSADFASVACFSDICI